MNLPRLLDQKSAAEYLSLPAAVVGRMATGRVLIDGRTRWDRVALAVGFCVGRLSVLNDPEA